MRLILAVATLLAATGWGATGTLKTDVNPGRAGVFVDGKYIGPAKNFGKTRGYAIEEGEHEIRLTEPRYEDVVTKVTISAGKTTRVQQTLKALPKPQGPFGLLRTMHPDKFAAVYVYGKFMGHVDEFSNFAQGLKLPAGTYDVQIVPVSGAPITKTVTIEANKTAIVQ